MLEQQTIQIIEKDTLEFDLSIRNHNGTPYVLDPNDLLWFCVKKNYSDINPTIYIEQNETHFKIDCSEYDFPPDTWKYEVGIIFSDGTERTLITNSSIIVRRRLKD